MVSDQYFCRDALILLRLQEDISQFKFDIGKHAQTLPASWPLLNLVFVVVLIILVPLYNLFMNALITLEVCRRIYNK